MEANATLKKRPRGGVGMRKVYLLSAASVNAEDNPPENKHLFQVDHAETKKVNNAYRVLKFDTDTLPAVQCAKRNAQRGKCKLACCTDPDFVDPAFVRRKRKAIIDAYFQTGSSATSDLLILRGLQKVYRDPERRAIFKFSSRPKVREVRCSYCKTVPARETSSNGNHNFKFNQCPFYKEAVSSERIAQRKPVAKYSVSNANECWEEVSRSYFQSLYCMTNVMVGRFNAAAALPNPLILHDNSDEVKAKFFKFLKAQPLVRYEGSAKCVFDPKQIKTQKQLWFRFCCDQDERFKDHGRHDYYPRNKKKTGSSQDAEKESQVSARSQAHSVETSIAPVVTLKYAKYMMEEFRRRFQVLLESQVPRSVLRTDTIFEERRDAKRPKIAPPGLNGEHCAK